MNISLVLKECDRWMGMCDDYIGYLYDELWTCSFDEEAEQYREEIKKVRAFRFQVLQCYFAHSWMQQEIRLCWLCDHAWEDGHQPVFCPTPVRKHEFDDIPF